jgi:hypothetical protein
MNELIYLQTTRKAADINLHLLATIVQLGHADQLKISPELCEMLEYALAINWQQYRLTTEKLNNYGNVLQCDIF